MRPVKGYENSYLVSRTGDIYSLNKEAFLKTRPTTTSPYLYTRLYRNGKIYHTPVHRVVAFTFIPNPMNKPEVDHIDKNILNNDVSNLRWVTRKENLEHSYTTMSPVRNFRRCTLFYNGVKVKDFQSINECCRYAATELGMSFSSLNKYRKVGKYEIKCND
jgi:hypothetical protein